jgi:hypothetical protein
MRPRPEQRKASTIKYSAAAMRPGAAFSMRAMAVVAGLAVVRDARAFDWEPQPQQPPEGTTDPASGPAPDEPPAPTVPLPHIDFEVAAQTGYLTPPIRGGTNPFDAGFGGRTGLVLSNFYVGVSVMGYLGGKDVDVSYRAMLYGLELGYGARWRTIGGAQLVVRPLLGIGAVAITYEDPTLAQQVDVVTNASTGLSSRVARSDTITVNNIYLQPAVTAMIASGAWFAGVGASVLVLPGISYGGAEPTTWFSFGLQAQAGLRL